MSSLYVENRPATWGEVVGQDAVVATIKTLLAKEKKAVPKAWLISGPPGTGKTTLSRLIAKDLGATGIGALEEINGANHNGVDDVRAIISRAGVLIHGSSAKVFILDECHMLSRAAQNALLKILEEPPQFTTFILTTTEPEALIPTITSRCKQFSLRALSNAKMVELRDATVASEGLKISKDNLDLAVREAGGSPRTLLNMLESADASDTDASARETILKQQSAGAADGDKEIANYIIFDLENKYSNSRPDGHKTPKAMWTEVSATLTHEVYRPRADLKSVKKGVLTGIGNLLIKGYNPGLSAAASVLAKSFDEYGNGATTATFHRMVEAIWKERE